MSRKFKGLWKGALLNIYFTHPRWTKAQVIREFLGVCRENWVECPFTRRTLYRHLRDAQKTPKQEPATRAIDAYPNPHIPWAKGVGE